MADQEKKEEQPQKRKLALRTVLILVGALGLQCALIAAVFIFAGPPRDLHADGSASDAAALAEQPVEMEVINERFQNTRTGRSYLYDTEIYVVTQRRYHDDIEQRVEDKRAQIRADLTTIFRRAEPAHLKEQELSTLRRQIHDVLNEHLGYDEEGEPLIERVLIPYMMRIRGDM